jgi:murein DD-endopeptidase MepM/ murein hydrolase activator NlpD
VKVLITLTLFIFGSVALADVGVGADKNRETNDRIQREGRENRSDSRPSERSREPRTTEGPRERAEPKGKPEVVDAKRRDEAAVREQVNKNEKAAKEKPQIVDARRRDEAAVKEQLSKNEKAAKEKPQIVDAKRRDEAAVKEQLKKNEKTAKDKPQIVDAKRDDETRLRIADTVKPPFSASPLLQPLNPSNQQSDNAAATPSGTSPKGGYPGRFRSQNTKNHYGLDDPSAHPETDVSYYTGTVEGVVVNVGESAELGKTVTIQSKTEDGATWTSKTLHHHKILVEKGQRVGPGQAIAIGAGAGTQFQSPEAGKPHVHWEVTRNGKTVNPLTGEILRVQQPKK